MAVALQRLKRTECRVATAQELIARAKCVQRRPLAYTLRATRTVGGFNHPIDAEIVGRDIDVLEYGGKQSLWRVRMPQ